MKYCPSCGKEAFDAATKCVFCGTLFEQKKVRWYFKTSSIIVGFLVVGPFVLPAVWANPHYSTRKKLVVTAAVLFFTYMLTVWVAKALSTIAQYYRQALNMQNGNY